MDNNTNLESFRNQPNYILNLCQAAQVLGYKDYRKIEFFIDSGFLKAYRLPNSKRKKVMYHEVMSLAEKIKVQ